MRILLKLKLDCTPDAAWHALRSPVVFQQVSAPFTTFTSLEPGGFPELWPAGDHRVLARAFGIAKVGTQNIGISFPQRADEVRIVRDSGPALSGPLTIIRRWQHQMSVAPTPDGRTLYRDELKISAGLVTPLAWLGLWAFWQWRALRIRQLAPTW